MINTWICETRNSNDVDYDNPIPHAADLMVKIPGALNFSPICIRHICCLRAGFEVAALQTTPPTATPLNFRTRIHLAPNGEVQYVHLEKDGQTIGLTIEQATSLAKEISARLGLEKV